MVAILLIFAGCKSGPEDSSKLGVYLVQTKQTGFYRFGPAQNNGPDFNLQNGQRVAMLKYERAFSKVMMENGFSGFVATEDLKAAPPPPKQPRASRSIFGRRRGGQITVENEVLESGPLFDQFNLPPLPEDPAPGESEILIPPETKVPLPLPR